jgi:hypothetical protein
MIVTLTTDFGVSSPYVPALKGVLLRQCPTAVCVDLTHSIPAQEVRHAAYFLADCVPYFPANTLHLVVVDPGVGTSRALLYVECAGQRLLAPDNGVLSAVLAKLDGPPLVRQLTDERWWRSLRSATFHGRDILAPVAGHLLSGLPPAELGPLVTGWQTLPEPMCVATADGWRGEVVFIDDFGNLLTNLPGGLRPCAVWLDDQRLTCKTVNTYGDAAVGATVVLTASNGCLELAVVNGAAERRHGARVGSSVQIGISASILPEDALRSPAKCVS